MSIKKIAVVTGSRADYGLLCPLMKLVQQDPNLELQIIATGSHLSKIFGMTCQTIEEDGFKINEKIEILSGQSTAVEVTKAMGKAVTGYADALQNLKPDIIILLGDRYEILAAAQAALIAKIPVAHIAGGDLTEGAFDDAIRHSITKMSHLHFVTHESAKNRVRQLGENPGRIFVVGHPGIDQIKRLNLLDRENLQKELDFLLQARNLLITFHPATLDPQPAKFQFEELLKALDRLGPSVGLIFTKPNADTEGISLIERLDQYVGRRKNAKSFSSLGQLLYFSTMKHADAVVGNSSSGIYEAPSFKKPTVNIGDRQKGRLQASSVIHCEPDQEDIFRAIQEAFVKDCSTALNPYGDGNSSERIFGILKGIKDPKALIKKRFHEISEFALTS